MFRNFFRKAKVETRTPQLHPESSSESPTRDLGDENFECDIAKDPVAVVICWATYCGPCHRMRQTLEEVASRSTNFRAYAINIEEATTTAASYNVSGTPTLLLFEHGKLRAQRFGSLPANKLRAWIKENSNQANVKTAE
ncbi:MAG: thioredoxin family protein [Pseudomonadota bacterium]